MRRRVLRNMNNERRNNDRHVVPKVIGVYVEVDPDFGTGCLIGRAAVALLDGADHDEESTTKD
jgi:hypothetical protein